MGIRKTLLVIVGFIALVLGGIGLFLPIMPTTPFVLVAAACFGGSNQKLYNSLATSKYFGEFVRNYREKTGVDKKTKVQAIAFLWGTLILSALIFRQEQLMIIFLIVGVCVTIHIASLENK